MPMLTGSIKGRTMLYLLASMITWWTLYEKGYWTWWATYLIQQGVFLCSYAIQNSAPCLQQVSRTWAKQLLRHSNNSAVVDVFTPDVWKSSHILIWESYVYLLNVSENAQFNVVQCISYVFQCFQSVRQYSSIPWAYKLTLLQNLK